MAKFKFTLPTGRQLTIRELTVRDLDEIATEAARGAGGDPYKAVRDEQILSMQRALVALSGVEGNGEELYHKLSPKERGALELAYKQIHDLTEAEAAGFLATMETA